MLSHIDRLQFTGVPAPGTGAVSLTGLTPPTGFRALATVPAGGIQIEYVIFDAAGLFETGIGTLDAGAASLTRTYVLSSSAATQGDAPSAVNFSAAVTVLCGPAASNAVAYYRVEVGRPEAEQGALAIGRAWAYGVNSMAFNGTAYEPRQIVFDADGDKLGGGLVLSATGDVSNDNRVMLWVGKASTHTTQTRTVDGKGYGGVASQIVGLRDGGLRARLVGSDYGSSHWMGELTALFVGGAIVAQQWTLTHQVGAHTPPAPVMVHYTYPAIELQPYASATWDVTASVEVLIL